MSARSHAARFHPSLPSRSSVKQRSPQPNPCRASTKRASSGESTGVATLVPSLTVATAPGAALAEGGCLCSGRRCRRGGRGPARTGERGDRQNEQGRERRSHGAGRSYRGSSAWASRRPSVTTPRAAALRASCSLDAMRVIVSADASRSRDPLRCRVRVRRRVLEDWRATALSCGWGPLGCRARHPPLVLRLPPDNHRSPASHRWRAPRPRRPRRPTGSSPSCARRTRRSRRPSSRTCPMQTGRTWTYDTWISHDGRRQLLATNGVSNEKGPPSDSPITTELVGNTIRYAYDGQGCPSNWVGLYSAELTGSPLVLVRQQSASWNRVIPCSGSSEEWSWRDFSGRATRDCTRGQTCETRESMPIPEVTLPEGYRGDGGGDWSCHRIDGCSVVMDGTKGHGYVTFGERLASDPVVPVRSDVGALAVRAGRWRSGRDSRGRPPLGERESRRGLDGRIVRARRLCRHVSGAPVGRADRRRPRVLGCRKPADAAARGARVVRTEDRRAAHRAAGEARRRDGGVRRGNSAQAARADGHEPASSTATRRRSEA